MINHEQDDGLLTLSTGEQDWIDVWQTLEGKEIPGSTTLAQEFLARAMRELSKKCGGIVGIDINRDALNLAHYFSER